MDHRYATILLLATACATAPAVRGPAPEEGEVEEPVVRGTLPAVPAVDGPLAIRVVYPPAGTALAIAESSFVHGSVGSGQASLTINGQRVRVWPNGAFLGWIAFPTGSDLTLDLTAQKGRETVRLRHPLRRVPAFTPPTRGVWVDTTSFQPWGAVWWPEGEPLPMSVRASEGASLRLVLPGGRAIPLTVVPGYDEVSAGIRAFDRDSTNLIRPSVNTRYVGALRGVTLGPSPGPLLATGSSPRNGPAILEAARGRDTVRVAWPLRLTSLSGREWVEIDDDPDRTGTTDGLTPGRAMPGGTYHWFFPTGTRVAATARINGDLRLRLSDGADAWVALAETRRLGAGAVIGPAMLGPVTAEPARDRVLVRIPLGWRVPFLVEEQDQGVTVRLYGVVGNPDWMRHGATTGLLSRLAWRQTARDEAEVDVVLSGRLWGYRTRWDRNDLLLEVRPGPAIRTDEPLRGRLIVVDPGHPPAGSIGPTGLVEAEANLAVSVELERLLKDAGAYVVLTRRSDGPVDLPARLRVADSLDADLLVSIHNNALPDGVNPFRNHGTSSFYFHPRSAGLARAIQHHLAPRLGLPDLGATRADLAMVRGTWMPSVLIEGMFMIVPDQEAALRTPAGRRLYAEGVVAGLRRFLAGHGL